MLRTELLRQHRNFNSIKVQLKHLILLEIIKIVKFQFHKGTIKTTQSSVDAQYAQNFNSIKVQLKQHADILCALLANYFNSIKVQLKQSYYLCLYPYFVFQFHKGTIKTADGSTGRDLGA